MRGIHRQGFTMTHFLVSTYLLSRESLTDYSGILVNPNLGGRRHLSNSWSTQSGSYLGKRCIHDDDGRIVCVILNSLSASLLCLWVDGDRGRKKAFVVSSIASSDLVAVEEHRECLLFSVAKVHFDWTMAQARWPGCS